MKCKIVLGLFVSFSIITFSQTSFAGDRCGTHKPGQAAFFEHSKYRGACVVRNVGRYSNSGRIGIGNDKISSIKVGPRTQIKLCKDNNFRGRCVAYTKSTPSLGSMNDKTSSAIISRVKISPVRCRPNANQVAFFEHVNYKGACSVRGLSAGGRGLHYGTSAGLGIANDTISSIKVGRAVNVEVCRHKGGGTITNNPFKKSPFKSRQLCQTFKKSIRNFKNQRIKNDSISSATIFDPKKRNFGTNGACKPKPNQAAVAVYQHRKYRGKCRVLSLGTYRNSKEMNFKNDSISSIEFSISPKVRIKVCQHSNFKGRCEIITNSISSLKSSRVGNDQITSISVGRR